MNMNIEITKPMTRLLAKHDELRCEAARHKLLESQLQDEEKELFKTADLDDPANFQKIANLRMKRELCPKKVEEFNEAADGVLRELDAECRRVSGVLLDYIASTERDFISEVEEALQDFFKGRPGVAQAVATQIFEQTNAAVEFYRPKNRLRSDGLASRPIIFRAKELLELVPTVLAVKVYCERITDPARAVKVLSAEQHETEELKNILRDPEPFIVSKMSYGLSREEAEKAVEGRRIHLQEQFQAPLLECRELEQIMEDPQPFVLFRMKNGLDREDAEQSVERRKIFLQNKYYTAAPVAAAQKDLAPSN